MSKNNSENNYVVATIKSWNIAAFHMHTKTLPGKWTLVTNKDELTTEFIKELNPKYIFFPHWSWIVPNKIFEHYECVCFHMTDVPYGRGGSPLQNLVARGHTETKITALKMCADLDAGPVYYKAPMSLHGTANEILKRSSDIIWPLISKIVETKPCPLPQNGEVVNFKRRKREDGNLAICKSPKEFYDFIRMLDGEGYPRAYIETEHAIINFENADLENDLVRATVTISRKDANV